MMEAEALSRRRRPVAVQAQFEKRGGGSGGRVYSGDHRHQQDILLGESQQLVARPQKTTKRKRDNTTTRNNRKKNGDYYNNDQSFYVIFLQTGVVLSLVVLCIWTAYRYLAALPVVPEQELVASSLEDEKEDDHNGGGGGEGGDFGGGSDINNNNNNKANSLDRILNPPVLDYAAKAKVEKTLVATEYAPPPLPHFNLSQKASSYDAFAVAELVYSKESKDNDDDVEDSNNNHKNNRYNNHNKDFWLAAAKLRHDFADYYGGENPARALVDLGLSSFGWEYNVDDHHHHHDPPRHDPPNRNNNDTQNVAAAAAAAGGDDENDTKKRPKQFPSDLRHTACRIRSAYNAKRPFRFTFGGYSVTVGRGNYFHQSYPFVLERLLHDVFSLLGIQLEVKNAAIGGCPSFPYGWCMKSFWGTETDVVSWDFSMNEAGGDPLGLEAYIRHVVQLPRHPKLIVKDAFMASRRRDVLRYYLEMGALPDPVVLHTDRATEPFLMRQDRDLPLGFRDWRKFGAPHGAPGQALHHPASKEHEFIGWILAMHFLAPLELFTASLQHDNINLGCDEDDDANNLATTLLPKPFATFDNTMALPSWTSLLFGTEDHGTHGGWRMRPIHCRTTFEPIVEGADLSLLAASGAVALTLDVMLPKSKMYYNRGWVMDLSEKEKAAKRTLSVYGGLGFIDSKKAFYGIVMSGKLKLFLPFVVETRPSNSRGGVVDQQPPKYPKAGDKGIDWFHSVVICKVNEKRDVDTCNMQNDLRFEVGGVDMINSTEEINSSGTLYLGRKICVYIPVSPQAVLTTVATIQSRNDNDPSLRGRRNIVFPTSTTNASKDKNSFNNNDDDDTRVGLEVSVMVRNHLLVQVAQACSVSHAIWEQQIVT